MEPNQETKDAPPEKSFAALEAALRGLVEKGAEITSGKLIENSGYGHATIAKFLRQSITNGTLKRVGYGRSTRYKLGIDVEWGPALPEPTGTLTEDQKEFITGMSTGNSLLTKTDLLRVAYKHPLQGNPHSAINELVAKNYLLPAETKLDAYGNPYTSKFTPFQERWNVRGIATELRRIKGNGTKRLIVTGLAGTGKTTYYAKMQKSTKFGRMLIVAPSGKARKVAQGKISNSHFDWDGKRQ